MSALTDLMGDFAKNLGVHTVYGDRVEIEGTTLVPVALVAYGFGGGGSEEQGDGGGGGGYAIPVGVYAGDSLGVRFQPNTIALLAVGIPFTWVAGHALARIIRALKK